MDSVSTANDLSDVALTILLFIVRESTKFFFKVLPISLASDPKRVFAADSRMLHHFLFSISSDQSGASISFICLSTSTFQRCLGFINLIKIYFFHSTRICHFLYHCFYSQCVSKAGKILPSVTIVLSFRSLY